MSEIFTGIKTVLFSILILMVLQMKWEGETLETHSRNWVYRSQAGEQLQYVASGVVKASREGWEWLRAQMNSASRPLERDRDSRR